MQRREGCPRNEWQIKCLLYFSGFHNWFSTILGTEEFINYLVSTTVLKDLQHSGVLCIR
ncbi:hypothetical protein NSE_0769 [Neorickettsia sennetsu str. Miyayama]|uniref:Uncharacterized protein n=1 Tax=Ehrlichia sennetsu (strain ATCC VR-367 / Miyayama) TaxID=222891 RepID=Q2GD02_EHRS3|nr:hypothetical protein NSE_0769 [Neorickettsia sennetsu str. Miyayama]